MLHLRVSFLTFRGWSVLRLGVSLLTLRGYSLLRFGFSFRTFGVRHCYV